MKSTGTSWGILTLVLLGGAAGLVLWLGSAGEKSPDVRPKNNTSTNADNSSDKPRPLAGNSTTDESTRHPQVSTTERAEAVDPDGDHDEKMDAAVKDSVPEWNPEVFRNTRFLTVPPLASGSIDSVVGPNNNDGRPWNIFIPGFRSYSEWSRKSGRYNARKPIDDGALELHVRFFGYDSDSRTDELREAAKALTSSAVVSIIAPGGEPVYRFRRPKEGGFSFTSVIPVELGRTDMLGITITGPNMLDIEGFVSRMGHVDSWGNNLSEDIHIEGEAHLGFRLFPSDHADFRSLKVRTEDGRPVENAMLIFHNQIYGRSDQSGALRFPWPGSWQSTRQNRTRTGSIKTINDTTEAPEKYFFVSAPGYVPVLVERSALANRSMPLNVTLRARELLVSAHHRLSDPSVTRFGVYPRAERNYGRSTVLFIVTGKDLIPLPDDFREIETWEDAHRGLAGSYSQSRYERYQESGRLTSFGVIYAGPYYLNDDFGQSSARQLGEALGREPTEHWPMYARWYFGRWDYNHDEGRFDVVLPYPGRFLLVVGEYNRGSHGELVPDGRRLIPGGNWINGAITHVLYLDARNPAELKSKLLVHPQG